MKKWLIAALILILSLMLFSASGAEEVPQITEISVESDQTHMLLKASFPKEFVKEHPEQLIYLFAMMPGETGMALEELTPIASQRIEDEITFRFYLSGRFADRIFACYQLAGEINGAYVPLGSPSYMDKPEMMAQITAEHPTSPTKKGIQTQLYADAQILGAAHTTVMVAVNELISTIPTKSSFVYADRTYYLDPTQLELLDYKVRRLSQSDMLVYLNFVLTKPKAEKSAEAVFDLSELYYTTDSESAQFFAYQIENENAAHLLQGLIRFLTARYTRADRQYGFAASFIVGYEVNSNRFRNYRGNCLLPDYAASYAKLMRTFITASRSVYSGAKVYLSLANNWTTPSIDATVTSTALLDYSAKDFLAAFLSAMKAQGPDVDWSIAVNPYPSDLTRADFWNDERATDSPDTEYLTMKNISVLTSLLRTSDYRNGDKIRRVLISEFGVSGQINTESETLQAAAFAYAYYLAEANEGIEAIIWHRQVDRIGENNLYFGLWSSDYKDILSPVEKKQIYDVFRFIDISRHNPGSESDVAAFALPLIGAESWEELIPTHRVDGISKRHFYEAVSQLPQDATLHETRIYDFSTGNTYSFFPSDSARYLEILPHQAYGKVLNAVLYPTNPVEYAGIASYARNPISIENESHLRLRLASSHGDSTEKVSVLIRLTGSNASGMPCVFEGAATIEPGPFATLTFHIEEYAKAAPAIDSIRIWIKGHEGVANGDCTLSIASISLLHPSHFSIHSLIITVLAVLCAVAVVILIVYFIIAAVNKHKRKRQHQMHRGTGRHQYHLGDKRPGDQRGARDKIPDDTKKG